MINKSLCSKKNISSIHPVHLVAEVLKVSPAPGSQAALREALRRTVELGAAAQAEPKRLRWTQQKHQKMH